MMPQLNRIFVIHTTADEEDADSDADFQLQIARSVPPDVLRTFEDLDHDDRERGRTDQYEFDVSGDNVNTDDPALAKGGGIIMRMINSDDGWLPKSIFVLGETIDGKTVVLGSHPQWDGGFFDTGHDPDISSHVISNLQ
jgi:hypothetical protein